MQNTTTSHASGDADYEWAVQNMLLDECLAGVAEEEDYVDYANDDTIIYGETATADSNWPTWTCSTNESAGTGRGLSFPNPAPPIKPREGIRRRSRTNRTSSINTMVVKANPTNFRALVQHFTGCHSQLPHPPLPLKGKGPIYLNFAQYTITAPTPTPITYLSRNIPTSSHPPHGLQQQQGCLATANNNNNNNNDVNDATVLAAAASASTSEHPQSPPPPFTSFSSDHDEMELIARELSTVWETHDQYHYANWNNR